MVDKDHFVQAHPYSVCFLGLGLQVKCGPQNLPDLQRGSVNEKKLYILNDGY